MNPEGMTEREIVVHTIAYESSGCDFEEQIFVAKVIRTRAKRRSKTFRAICLQGEGGHFNCWFPNQVLKMRTSEEIKTAKEAWNESKSKNIEEINHYHEKDMERYPQWSKTMKRVYVTKNFIFYDSRRSP